MTFTLARVSKFAAIAMFAAGVATGPAVTPASAGDAEIEAAKEWLDSIGAMKGKKPWTVDDLKGVQYLSISPTSAKKQVKDDDLKHLQHLPRLTGVNLGGSSFEKVTDAGMPHVAAVPLLKRVTVAANKNISDEGVMALAQNKNLEVLTVAFVKMTDDSMGPIAEMPRLRELNINKTGVTDQGLATLAASKTAPRTLKTLWVQSMKNITDDGLAEIAKLKALEMIILDFSPIDEGLAHLATLPRLKRLQLLNASVTDKGGAHLGKFPSLTSLGLWGTRITDKTLPEVGKIETLETVLLHRTAVTDAGMPALAKMPRLKKVSLNRTAVSNDGIAILAESQSLENLTLSNTQIGNEALSHLSGLKSLKYVDVSRNPPITDEGILLLKDLPELRSVNARKTKVTKEGANSLKSALTAKNPNVYN